MVIILITASDSMNIHCITTLQLQQTAFKHGVPQTYFPGEGKNFQGVVKNLLFAQSIKKILFFSNKYENIQFLAGRGGGGGGGVPHFFAPPPPPI